MRRIQHMILVTVLILTLWTLIPSSGQAIIYINIDSPNIRKFYLAFPKIERLGIVPEEIAKHLRETLSQDLTISNLFHMMEEELPQRGVYITEKTVDYNAWAVVGAEFLLSVGLSVEGDNITIEFRLFDVVQGAYIAGKRYKGPANSVRLIAHRTADEIFYQLTGERGIFQTRIAFVADRTGNKEIYVMDFDGHNVEQVTKNGSINISPAWSPHGKSLLYTSFIRRNPDLYQVFLSTGNSILFSSVTGLNAAPDWSPDGQLIALMMRAKDNSDIYLLKKDGTNPTRLSKSWANEASPSWSPDGKQIAFLSDRSGSPQIYIMDLGTEKSRRLTYEGSYNCSPSWSPRGDKIAFAGRVEGTFHIFTMRTDGTDLRKLTMTGSNESPSWAPNGRYIAFTSTRGGNPDIYIMTADGGTSWKVTDTKSNETEPAWSPWLK